MTNQQVTTLRKRKQNEAQKVRVPMLTENVSSKPYYFLRIQDTEQSKFLQV